VIYESDGSKESNNDWRSTGAREPKGRVIVAYKQAVQKSQSVPGSSQSGYLFSQQAFAGTTTMDAETHIGLGTLDHQLIVERRQATTPHLIIRPSWLPWHACRRRR
jgi:hypothetical protein